MFALYSFQIVTLSRVTVLFRYPVHYLLTHLRFYLVSLFFAIFASLLPVVNSWQFSVSLCRDTNSCHWLVTLSPIIRLVALSLVTTFCLYSPFPLRHSISYPLVTLCFVTNSWHYLVSLFYGATFQYNSQQYLAANSWLYIVVLSPGTSSCLFYVSIFLCCISALFRSSVLSPFTVSWHFLCLTRGCVSCCFFSPKYPLITPLLLCLTCFLATQFRIVFTIMFKPPFQHGPSCQR